jgi:hypothetical protein
MTRIEAVRLASLALPGGALIGFRSGVVHPLSIGSANVLVHPYDDNLGFAIVSCLIGAIVGVVVGSTVGLPVAAVLAAGMLCRCRPSTIIVVASVTVLGIAAAGVAVITAIAFDPLWASVSALAAVSGIGGVILIVWLATLGSGAGDGRLRIS